MTLSHVSLLEDFGTRSVAVHALTVLAFANAVLAGLFLTGQVGLVSFVALLNFAAGLWLAHSIRSLGHEAAGGEYEGALNEPLDGGTDEAAEGLDTGRFGRLLALVAAVTAVALLTSAQDLPGEVFRIAIVVGSIAVVTAIIGFLIAPSAPCDESQRGSIERLERNEATDSSEIDG